MLEKIPRSMLDVDLHPAKNCMQPIKVEKLLLTLLFSEFNGNMPHALNIHEFHIYNVYIA